MNGLSKLKSYNFPWFRMAIVGIFLLSLFLRFWRLSQFNVLVFDEVYYAKYANDYLIGKPFFQSHPPLGQYLIAIAIWIGSHFPASPDTINNLTGSLRSTFSYRWLNALTGSFIPLVVGAIAYQLILRRSCCLLAMLFAATDGLFLVESRYALNNIYLVLFGLLGQLFLLIYIKQKRSLYLLALSGLFLGLSISIKWNALGFLLGIFLIIILARIKQKFFNITDINNLWNDLNRLKLQHILIYLILLPLLVYCLLWIPHLKMNPEYNFEKVHQEIFTFHQQIKGNDSKVHPYCSPWYSWLVMWRPVAYYYSKEILNNQTVIYDVHAMANPILLWLSTLAIILLLALISVRFGLGELQNPPSYYSNDIVLFLVCNYAANLLPWLKISRCTFFYHYMGSYVFSWLALAWILAYWLQSEVLAYRTISKILIGLIIIGFLYWLPLYLGLPLSEKGFSLRLIFPNWI